MRLVEWCVDFRSLRVMHLSETEPALCLCTGHKNTQVGAGVEHTTRGAGATQLTAGARCCTGARTASTPPTQRLLHDVQIPSRARQGQPQSWSEFMLRSTQVLHTALEHHITRECQNQPDTDEGRSECHAPCRHQSPPWCCEALATYKTAYCTCALFHKGLGLQQDT